MTAKHTCKYFNRLVDVNCLTLSSAKLLTLGNQKIVFPAWHAHSSVGFPDQCRTAQVSRSCKRIKVYMYIPVLGLSVSLHTNDYEEN